MIPDTTIDEIHTLFKRHAVQEEVIRMQRLAGTTSSLVLKLETRQGNTYILKRDDPQEIAAVEHFLHTYRDSALLPKVLFTAADNSYFAYSFIEGTTHFNRGAKKDWMALLAKELFNRYVRYEGPDLPGLPEYSQQSWQAFNAEGVEAAKSHIGHLLPDEDYLLVRSKVDKCFARPIQPEEKFLLHGDTGVHNFVFDRSAVIGVIDPAPMVAPLIYDVLYAFCSSPDDIDEETLYAAVDLLEQGRIDRSQLVEQVLIQLYCRFGLCVKHHPHDLPGYRKAWEEWRELCMRLDSGQNPESVK
ncbi:phosphotransferase [Saccharibacillus sp. CPCC 101409]|uniref:phosphotransferase n=1 Tax=Saccharibacillus sp. CPCC 101409 TaxID=3058041 RepID=UPI00267368D5|nr:phosphotransferase [Saccharibacillus sp. CPCC 101409]MDO3410581.1 phosphotransferase [Saccharibacillus sp. CPCC 101409]